MNGFATWYCQLVERTNEITDVKGNFGIFLAENTTSGSCYLPDSDGRLNFDRNFGNFPGSYMSTPWWQDIYLTVARATGMGALVSGAICWILMLLGLCCDCNLGVCFRSAMGTAAVLCFILTSFQFIVFQSEFLCNPPEDDFEDNLFDYGCTLAIGGFLNIASALFYLAAGILSCCIREDDEKE